LKQNETNETFLKQNETNEKPVTHNAVKKNTHICNICHTQYNSRTTLWRHKRTCTSIDSTELTVLHPNVNQKIQSNDIIDQLTQRLSTTQSNDKVVNILEQVLIQQTEQNKLIIELAKKPNNIHNNKNNCNNTFNLNTFLNVDCKDAMNIDEFMESIQVSIKDLKDIRTHGFLFGMDIAMMNKLRDMKQIERPIHCTDKKRKQFYIKKNNKWNKDCDQGEVFELFKDVNRKHHNVFNDWRAELDKNPKWHNNQRLFDEIIDILNKILELYGPPEEISKIKKQLFNTIIKYTTIDKSRQSKHDNQTLHS
jgi:hypothetical protein